MAWARDTQCARLRVRLDLEAQTDQRGTNGAKKLSRNGHKNAHMLSNFPPRHSTGGARRRPSEKRGGAAGRLAAFARFTSDGARDDPNGTSGGDASGSGNSQHFTFGSEFVLLSLVLTGACDPIMKSRRGAAGRPYPAPTPSP